MSELAGNQASRHDTHVSRQAKQVVIAASYALVGIHIIILYACNIIQVSPYSLLDPNSDYPTWHGQNIYLFIRFINIKSV